MYINFFPGNTRESRELSISTHDAYQRADLEDFVDSVLAGCTCSTSTEGAKDALEDGAAWASLTDKHGEQAVQDVLEELHALLSSTPPTNGAQTMSKCTHTTCRHCGQDIEGFAPYRRGEWRDRGNNSTCPDSKHGRKHAPYWPLNK